MAVALLEAFGRDLHALATLLARLGQSSSTRGSTQDAAQQGVRAARAPSGKAEQGQAHARELIVRSGVRIEAQPAMAAPPAPAAPWRAGMRRVRAPGVGVGISGAVALGPGIEDDRRIAQVDFARGGGGLPPSSIAQRRADDLLRFAHDSPRCSALVSSRIELVDILCPGGPRRPARAVSLEGRRWARRCRARA